MEFFIDTANLEEIRRASEYGLVDGVTTNPSLVAKEGRDFVEMIVEISRLVPGPISAEVISLEAEGMIEEAVKLAGLGDNIVIKIPMTVEGLKAVKVLADKGIKTNVTLIFSPLQALLAAKAGASYAAEMGADVATIPFKVMMQLAKHPLTDIGIERFMADWQQSGKSK